jgi:hypothetical protein
MPASITNTKLVPHCFVSNCSSPARLHGLDRKATSELIQNLQKNFSVPQNPENFLGRTDTITENEGTKENSMPKTIIVIGSSIMGRVVGHLKALNLKVIDLTVPGWVATPENIETLISKLSSLDCLDDFAVVMDLHSNSTFRYKQFDYTLALPVKEGNRYHFPGEIKLIDDTLFKKITDSLGPVLRSAQLPR